MEVWVSVSAKENPCDDKGYLKKSPSDSDSQQWRRRESNGTISCRNVFGDNQLTIASKVGSAPGQRGDCNSSQLPSLSDTDDFPSDLMEVVRSWPRLSDNLRAAFVLLVNGVQ
jgi:hypothetical protein